MAKAKKSTTPAKSGDAEEKAATKKAAGEVLAAAASAAKPRAKKPDANAEAGAKKPAKKPAKATDEKDTPAPSAKKPRGTKPAADAGDKKPKAESKGKATSRKRASKEVEIVDEPEEDDDDGAEPGKPRNVAGKSLVVVESPAKARTIKKYLGRAFTVMPSVGHVKDLPKSKLGVDVSNRFEPEYHVIGDKTKVIKDIQKAAGRVETVYLAPDPDREGEAIAWHIAEEVRPINANIRRVLINEITKKGVTEAISNPTELNLSKSDAQQARRILDRLVGYEISPILWNKVRRGLSAGRVQSVAVRLLVEREQEIAAFKPDEYWTVDCECEAGGPPPFLAKIWRFNEEKAEPTTQAEAQVIADELRAGPAHVSKVEKKQRRRKPQPPFITSKLQQEAARKLRFTAKRTMRVAQRLYEGLEIGDEGPVGLITYMRTDSTRVSDDALRQLREFINATYGPDFLPETPTDYKTSKRAQDAHEAIRPTSMEYTPERVEKALRDDPDREDLIKLYRLIWQRFVASQMTPAVFDQTTVDIARGKATLRATGQILRFPGFTSVYLEQETDDEASEKAERQDRVLPPLEEGDAVTLTKILPEQHFTQPPPRFTEASLVKELEEKGIGRPSTYATILSTIVDRGYAKKDAGRFQPTELGALVNELLVASFPDILNIDFTAQMEAELDRVEEGERDWRDLLGTFYQPFKADLDRAKTEMRDVKREEIPTDHVCEKCGSPMVIKWGRNGSFLACQGYPECRNTKEIERKPDGSFTIVPEATTDEMCGDCGKPLKVKRGRFGAFLACSGYPDCKFTKAISVGVPCPRAGCGGFITEKRSKRGKIFFGCSNYAKTNCDFVSWDRPIKQACPECAAPFLVRKENKSGTTTKCLSCDYKMVEGEAEEVSAAESL